MKTTFIIRQFDRYETRELWQTESGFEIRTRRTGRDKETPEPGHDSFKPITVEEALPFRIEAERQQVIWDEIDAEHELVASFSNKYGNFELQKLADESHRVVSYQCPLETADDITIHPADEATIAGFMEQAGRWNDRDWRERLASKFNQEY